MKKILLVVFVFSTMLAACGGKSKKMMSGEESVDIKDFISFFDEIKLPLTLSDSILKMKNNDSTLIGDTIIKQFFGDTIFHDLYGKKKPKVYAYGRFRNEDQETYLLLKTSNGARAIYAVAFTPENKYSAGMLLISDGKKTNGVDKVVVDPRFTFTLVDSYKDVDGSINEFSQVYAYNNAGLFMVILKDGLQRGEVLPILNPVDTLPATSKFSGNYLKDSRNFISIRDGKTANDFVFFINMDKGATTDCQFELKGAAVFVTKDSAVYSSKSDPCKIGFKFGTSNIQITEITVCGNQRPADCSFNATYRKQKMPSEGKKKP